MDLQFGEEASGATIIRLDLLKFRSSVASKNAAEQWKSRIEAGTCTIKHQHHNPSGSVLIYHDAVTNLDDILSLTLAEGTLPFDLIPTVCIKCYCRDTDVTEAAAANTDDADEDVAARAYHLNLTIITYVDDDVIGKYTGKSASGRLFIEHVLYKYLCRIVSRDATIVQAAKDFVMHRNTPSEIEQLLNHVARSRSLTDDTQVPISPDMLTFTNLNLTLHQYQKRAVCWMVSRERASGSSSSSADNLANIKQFSNPKFMHVSTPADDEVYFSFFDGEVIAANSCVNNKFPTVTDTIRGGILADEMGLGKTIEILACILNDPVLIERKQKMLASTSTTEQQPAIEQVVQEQHSEIGITSDKNNFEKFSNVQKRGLPKKATAKQQSKRSKQDFSAVSEANVISARGTRKKIADFDDDDDDAGDPDFSLPDAEHLNITAASSSSAPAAPRRGRRSAAQQQLDAESASNAALAASGAMHGHDRRMTMGQSIENIVKTTTGSARHRALAELSATLLRGYSGTLALAKKSPSPTRASRIYVECICGNQSTVGVIKCINCGVYQHESCTGFYLNKKLFPENVQHSIVQQYHCPQCYQNVENLKTHATLVVVPRALLQQWFDEINKCVHSSALSVFIYNGTVVTKRTTAKKKINDRHKHANITSKINNDDSSTAGVIYTHPLVIAQYDIVITSYEVLRDELAFVDLPDMRLKLRHPKRYNNACSPLTGIRFRRLVFDEAQLVERSTRNMSQMAMRIQADFVWALTGTPIIQSFDDLYGLFKLLRERSLQDAAQFKYSLIIPYALCGDRQPLQDAVAHIMYRQTKNNVCRELNLPHLLRHVHMLEFDPIERAHYAVRQTATRATVRLHAADLPANRIMSELSTNTHQQLLEDVNALRLVCLHPMLAGALAGARSNAATFQHYEGKSRRKRAAADGNLHGTTVGLRDSLLKLIAFAKIDITDEQRKVLMHLNALAGVSWLDEDYAQAAVYYRQAVDEWRQLEPIGIEADRLQRIHTLSNLYQLVQLHGDSAGRTLNDDALVVQANKLKAEHVEKLTAAMTCANARLVGLQLTSDLRPLMQFPDDSLVWMVDLLNRDVLQSSSGGKAALDALLAGLTGLMMDQGFARRFASAVDAIKYLVAEWENLVQAHEVAYEAVEKLRKAELTAEFAQSAYLCHLAARSTYARTARSLAQQQPCDLCACTVALTKYEWILFRAAPNIRTAKKREGPRGVHTKTSASAADWLADADDEESELLGDVHKLVSDSLVARKPQALETIVAWLFTRRKTFVPKSSTSAGGGGESAENDLNERYAHMKAPPLTPIVFVNLGKEFWFMRVLMRTIQDRTSAFDEAGRQALLRIQVKPDEQQQPTTSAAEESRPKGSKKRKPAPPAAAAAAAAMTREYKELHPTKKDEEEARLYISRAAIPQYELKYQIELSDARAKQAKKLSKYRFVVSLRQRMKKKKPDAAAADASAAAENDAAGEDDDDPLARDILKDEKCPVCWEPLPSLTAYSFLPCAHFICNDDLTQLVRVNAGSVQCPQCREKCQPDSIVHVDNRVRAAATAAAAKPVTMSSVAADAAEASTSTGRGRGGRAATNVAVAAAVNVDIDADIDTSLLDEHDAEGDLSSKLAAVVKCLRRIKRLDPQAACLVFSSFPQAVKMLKTACQANAINAACVLNASEVSRMLDRLNCRQIDALIMSYQACSRGLNVTEANHVLLLEPVLNKADELQAIGRAYRIGQTRDVHVHYFITRNTIEERMHEAMRNVEAFSVPQSSVNDLTVEMVNHMVGCSTLSPASVVVEEE